MDVQVDAARQSCMGQKAGGKLYGTIGIRPIRRYPVRQHCLQQ
jgi:hypothetical protein